MADLGFKLNAEDAAADYRGQFEVVAPGWYRAVITASDIKVNKAGTGKYLELKYELTGGQAVIDRLNIMNNSEVAQKIGRSALGKIALSIGVRGELKNTDVLHGRPFEVKVEVEEFESNTEVGKMLKSNKITDYRAISAAPSQAVTSGAPAKPW